MRIKHPEKIGLAYRWALLLQLCLTTVLTHGQEISVLSFVKLENDMDARVSYPQKDRDGELAALLKVVTTETGFEFDGGLLGVVKLERRTGEYWVYVPRGAAAITIKHDQLGVLRNYVYPLPIEKASVYEMKLVSGRVKVEIEQPELQSEFLLVIAEPSDALIYINDVYEATGTLQKKLQTGTYAYRVESAMYHTDTGWITVTAGQTNEKQIVLKPNYGYIQVSSFPDTGAKVLIDGMDAGFYTNGVSKRLRSGEHHVTLVKDQYQTAHKRVTVRDEDTTSVRLELVPNYSELEIKIPAQSSLYINDKYQGVGSWSGRLNTGVYSVEVRQEKHRTVRQDYELRAGETKTIEILPELAYGVLEITSEPPRTTILIDGQHHGTSPRIVRNLLVGKYNLSLSALGYGTYTDSVEVTEGPPVSVHGVLPKGKEVSIESTPSGARVEIDGVDAGITPLKLLLGFASHDLKLTNNSLVLNEKITVSEEGDTVFFFNVYEFVDFVEKSENLSIEMVAVKGGRFHMGCNNYDETLCVDDERPGRIVQLDDFYIGRYEVTQQQWQAVMGDNPCYFFDCIWCPVEQVSWNDVQNFLGKLNSITGRSYRLPTEAEWEYAAKGGEKSHGYSFSGSNDASAVAWYRKNSGFLTKAVGTRQANELGIYDMSGNVFEWCNDWYGEYDFQSKDNPVGPKTGVYRVIRGGSYWGNQEKCRTDNRNFDRAGTRNKTIGFRLVCEP